MTTPLFKVGEKVVLQSKTMPEYNGVYYVHQVVFRKELIVCRITNAFVSYSNSHKPFGYILDTPIKLLDGDCEAIFCETTLRKYQEPSDYTFDELMSELKLTKVV